MNELTEEEKEIEGGASIGGSNAGWSVATVTLPQKPLNGILRQDAVKVNTRNGAFRNARAIFGDAWDFISVMDLGPGAAIYEGKIKGTRFQIRVLQQGTIKIDKCYMPTSINFSYTGADNKKYDFTRRITW